MRHRPTKQGHWNHMPVCPHYQHSKLTTYPAVSQCAHSVSIVCPSVWSDRCGSHYWCMGMCMWWLCFFLLCAELPVTLMVPLVPVITASQVSIMVIEQVQTASLFPENLRTKTAVPSTPGQKMEALTHSKAKDGRAGPPLLN